MNATALKQNNTFVYFSKYLIKHIKKIYIFSQSYFLSYLSISIEA